MSGPMFSGRDHAGDLRLDADVVVVGSGAGGAVAATELAEAGLDVVVLEEGPRVAPEAYGRMRASEAIRHAWRDGGATLAIGLGDTPSVNVTMGRCVGGSSVLTGGVCFRVPEKILHHWGADLGLTQIAGDALEPCFAHVEERIHVVEVPAEMRSRSTELFALGAARCGYPVRPLRRNTEGCRGCGQCNFGCPHGAKRSVDLSYLPRAARRGARIGSHCLVERVVIDRGRAVGVRGCLLGRPGGRPGGRLEVRAERVVLAAGAWHTPLVLRRTGVRGPHVGSNLTLHPAFRVLARFPDPVRGWKGALQSAYCDGLEDEDITLVGLFVPVGVLGATMPGLGPEHWAHARHIDHLAMFGGLIHDQGGGRVRRGPGREPVVTYRMAPRDRSRFPRLVTAMAEAFFAAGAERVYLPILGHPAVDADGFRALDLGGVPSRRIECASQHPLGSCRMGTSPERSVVDQDGRVWGVDGLFIADGSIVPTSLGVNPQLTVMALATRVAWRMVGRC